MKKIIAIILVFIFIIFISIISVLYYKTINNNPDIWQCDKNGQWVKNGNPSMAKPEFDCRSLSSYSNNLSSSKYSVYEILIKTPFGDEAVSSPILIKGTAKGNWYFEGSFPIQLVDEKMNIITSTYATAMSDWMTTNYVDFTATVTYKISTTTKGYLIFKKDNPSGLPQNDKSEKVPVIIK